VLAEQKRQENNIKSMAAELRDRQISNKNKLIIAALEKNKGNASKTAREHNVSRHYVTSLVDQDILKRWRSNVLSNNIAAKFEVIKMKKRKEHQAREIQKQEIINAIEKFGFENNCLQLVSEHLDMPKRTLQKKMKKYGIVVNAYRYPSAKVIPVLKQTKGDLQQAAVILGISKDTLYKYFGRETERIRKRSQEKELLENSLLITEALEKTDGSRPKAARLLGMSERSLYKWLQKIRRIELDEIDKVLADLKAQALDLNHQNPDSMRYFLGMAAVKVFYGGELLLNQAIKKKNGSKHAVLNQEIKAYKDTISKLNNRLMNVDRRHRSKMLKTVNALIAIVDENQKTISRIHEQAVNSRRTGQVRKRSRKVPNNIFLERSI
jgi:DNA-binding NtrC family response regulator